MQRHNFANKGPYSQVYGLSSSHVWLWELDHKEGRTLKNWFFQIVVLEKTLESPLDYKGINFKGNQPWIFIGRTDADAEALILWTSDVNSQLIGKDPDAWKDWRQKEKNSGERSELFTLILRFFRTHLIHLSGLQRLSQPWVWPRTDAWSISLNEQQQHKKRSQQEAYYSLIKTLPKYSVFFHLISICLSGKPATVGKAVFLEQFILKTFL